MTIACEAVRISEFVGLLVNLTILDGGVIIDLMCTYRR
jgi:hypothetical protein